MSFDILLEFSFDKLCLLQVFIDREVQSGTQRIAVFNLKTYGM